MTVSAAGQSGSRRGIEKSTPADSDAWFAALRELPAPSDLPPVIGNVKPSKPKISLFNACVVLKPFVYPAGLYGGHAATFLVPKGTLHSTGNPGHSAVYRFYTMTCSRALCAAR